MIWMHAHYFSVHTQNYQKIQASHAMIRATCGAPYLRLWVSERRGSFTNIQSNIKRQANVPSQRKSSTSEHAKSSQVIGESSNNALGAEQEAIHLEGTTHGLWLHHPRTIPATPAAPPFLSPSFLFFWPREANECEAQCWPTMTSKRQTRDDPLTRCATSDKRRTLSNTSPTRCAEQQRLQELTFYIEEP